MISLDDRGPFPDHPKALNIARHVLWNNGADDAKVALSVLSASGAYRLSYGELRQRVLATAMALLESGVGPGDRLLMRIGNCPEFPIVFLGAIAAGIFPVPTSAALTKHEITQVARRLRPVATVASKNVSLPDDAPLVLSATTLTQHKNALPEPIDTKASDPAYAVFTSGTSGAPDGIVHAHRAIWARRAMINGWCGMRHTDRVFHVGAMNWTYTLGTGLLDPWSVGATALALAPETDATQLPLLASRFDATLIAGAPGNFRRMLAAPLPPLQKLRHGLSAGERLAPELRASWAEKTGTDLIEAFGQSECSTFVSGSPDQPAPPGTVGFAQPGRRVAILDETGPVPRGNVGEIAVDARDPGIMLEYLDQPEAKSRRLRNGWFLTGDMGRMEPDGAITHLGRLDDILTAGGYRISPTEIEEAMLRHPDILDAAAVDLKLGPGKTIVALHYASEVPIPHALLAAHAETCLARYKLPREFIHHLSLPRGPSGKLLRARLRAATDGRL